MCETVREKGEDRKAPDIWRSVNNKLQSLCDSRWSLVLAMAVKRQGHQPLPVSCNLQELKK